MSEQPRKAPQHAVLAIPTYDGRVFDTCMGSVYAAQSACIQAGIFTTLIIKSDSPYLPIVRNKLVADFLEIPSATDLVFIDADVGFDPAALPRLLSYDADVVGGVYPKKQDPLRWPVLLDEDENEDGLPKVDAATGLPLARLLPTGFLRIRRGVFEKMRAEAEEWREEIVEYGSDGSELDRYWPYFHTPMYDGQWWGEDVDWCARWRETHGGQLLLDPDIAFSHTGRKHWEGNYHQYRMRQPGGALHETPPEQEESALQTRLAEIVSKAREGMAPLNAMDLSKGIPADKPVDLTPSQQGGMRQDADETERIAREVPTAVVPRVPDVQVPRREIMGGAGVEAGEYRELLLGCGSAKEKRVTRDGRPANGEAWQHLTTLDVNADHKPDVVYDLNGRYWPFDDDIFDEVHAYEVLEHLGTQGDYRAFFAQFTEIWRILKPGGVLCATVPHWQSVWAWGDPSHTRVINEGTLTFLDQGQYMAQVGKTAMSDFRFCYRADLVLKHSARAGDQFVFVLEAVKPSRWRAP